MAFFASQAMKTMKYDILIYDATTGGITAAVSASRANPELSIALLCASWPGCFTEGGHTIGGMSASGLSHTDISTNSSNIGGLAKEFYTRNFRNYFPVETPGNLTNATCRTPNLNCSVTYNLEPSVAQSIFKDMLAECENVQLIFEQQVTEMKGTRFQFSTSFLQSAIPLTLFLLCV
jgi:hypothetical protein